MKKNSVFTGSAGKRARFLPVILAIDPETEPIMTAYGMHCMGCPFSQMETLEQGCAAHGTDADELVEKLNAFLAAKA